MKRLVLTLAICLGCFGILEAQNIWKPVGAPGYILAVAPNGYLYSTSFEEGSLWRSTDEGLNWELVFYNSDIYSGTDMAVSKQGRAYVAPNYSDNVYYSDDNGDTWHITPRFPTCWVEGMYAVSNDTLLIWGENEYGYESLHFTLDGGQTWSSADLNPMGQTHNIGDVIANEAGDVFVSFWSSNAQNDGIYQSNYTDFEHWDWELAAFPNTSIKDMEFDPDGNVVAVAFAGEFNGFQQVPGFYLAGNQASSLGVADNGYIYLCNTHGNNSVLAFSEDHGAHFQEIGESLAGADGTLFKGRDNHLYFYGNSNYWKSIDEAGFIGGVPHTFAPQGAEWYFDVFNPWTMYHEYERFSVEGDTIIQGHQCSIIEQHFVETGPGHENGEFVYEEDNKVYWFNPTTNAFTLLYDFDAEVGDSWYYEVDSCSHLVTVDSVGSVIWNGRTYRTQWVSFSETYTSGSYGKIIEGIGYEKGLFPSIWTCNGSVVYDASQIEYLRCYVENGEIIYHEGNYACDAVYPNNTTCWDGTVAETYAGGNGTAENPYQIATPQQLALLAQQSFDGTGSEAHYILLNDICLNDEGGTLEWPMIGREGQQNSPKYFRGVFDGNGHIIKGMYVNEYHVNSGLFGITDGAVIKNLTVDDSRILTGNGMGILVGSAQNTDILNCVVTNGELVSSISSTLGSMVGSIGAYHTTDTVFLKDCVCSNVRVGEGSANMGGGVVGYASATNGYLVIENCANFSNMEGQEEAGGILGCGGVVGDEAISALIIRGCENFGAITAESNGGGIVGYCWDAEVSQCFNWGEVSSNRKAGGIVGQTSRCLVMECANRGNVSSTSTVGSEVGGIVGAHSAGVLANCYNRGAVSALYGEPGRSTEAIGGIVGNSTGRIFNVYNAGTVTGPELPSGFGSAGYGAIVGLADVQEHYLNCYWLFQNGMSACGNADMPDLSGSSAFVTSVYSGHWELETPQYGTDDLLEALNFGAAVVLDSVPDYPYLTTWLPDTENTNEGLPVIGGQPEPGGDFQAGDLLYKIISSVPPCVRVIGHVDGENAQGELVIPETVTYLGFDYTVTEVGDHAFQRCSGLTGTLTFPTTMRIIGVSAFAQCTGFTELALPEGLLEIREMAFRDCTGFTGTLDFPETMTHIKYGSFNRCTGFSGDLVLPNSVREVGNTQNYSYFYGQGYISTFADCFDHLVLSQSLDTIGYGCFSDCEHLTGTLVMPEGLKTIYNEAFYSCYGLTGLTLNDSLAFIGSRAFDGCGFTGTLVIPENVELGSFAFAQCNNIEALALPHHLTISEGDAGGYAFGYCRGLVELDIPEGWTETGRYNFTGCYNLRRVHLPESLRSISTNTFSDCISLEEINIPESVTEIGYAAFMSCDSLTNVVLPSGLLQLGSLAFSHCSNLAGDMIVPDLVERIESNIFHNCASLNRIILGDSVNYIEEDAFSDTQLEALVIKATTPPELYRNPYSGVWHIPADHLIIVPCGTLEAYQNSEDWGSFTNIVEDCGSGLVEFHGSEWYYEIENLNGSITYQHLEYAADTTIHHKDVQIIIRTNTLYDKDGYIEVTHEYVYEEDNVVYWWNNDLQEFTVLYNLGAEQGDEWEIKVGTETITMHVDAVEQYYYDGRLYRMLRVSDDGDLFSGTIVCGIGHLNSFFPERLMNRGKAYRVEGMRCYWRNGELVFKYGDEDCDAVYKNIHFGIEESVENQFNIYPNPTDGVLFVETHGRASLLNQTYRITNLMGQTLMTGQITGEIQQIDVTNLPDGMYFITVGDMTQKFVIR